MTSSVVKTWIVQNTRPLSNILAKSKIFLRSDASFTQILVNSGWLLSANVVGMLLNLVQGVLVARTLGVEEYGVLGLVMTFVTVINSFTSFRMGEFVIKFMSDALALGHKDEAAITIKVAMGIEASASILAFAIVFALAPLGAQWFVQIPEGQILIITYAIIILGNLVSETSTGVLQVFKQFQMQSIMTFISRVVSLLAVGIAFLLGQGLWGILVAYLMSNLISASMLLVVTLVQTRRHLGSDWWHISINTMNGKWRSAANFAFSTNLSTTLSLVTKNSDLLWLGFFRSPAEVGYYKLATSLAGLVFLPVGPLGQTVYPQAAHYVALGEWAKFKNLLQKASLLVSIYVIPAGILVSIFSPWLISTFYGNQFAPAAIALAILLVGSAFANTFFWSRPALLVINLPEYPTKINVLIAVLKVIGVFLLVPTFGYVGNAVLLTILYLVGVTLSVLKVRREVAHQAMMRA